MLSVCERIISEYEAESKKNKKTAIIICGPTASGKTGLSLSVAKELGGEIVSCDSMQIYRHMDIGTAKATLEEQAVAPHHMIDIVDPWESYNAYKYKVAAEDCINGILGRGKVPVVVGGTGLYVNSLVDNREYTGRLPSSGVYDPDSIEKIKRLDEEGRFEELYDILKSVDGGASEIIHQNNKKRVFRALELYFTTGKTQAVRNAESVMIPPDINYNIYCMYPDRAALYERINKRVDLMLEQGLLSEVSVVYNMCVDKLGSRELAEAIPSLQAIGYKELIPFVRDGISEVSEAAADLVKLNSRHYAKRQLTWFRKTPGVQLID